jgi:hypothetical protein
MTMRSPIVAMLWEIWRLTRVEVAWRLALGIVGGAAVLVLVAAIASNLGQGEAVSDFGAAMALIIIVMLHVAGWLSLTNLNSGRPGFPLYLLYTRPVRTSVLVGVPMVYVAATPAAIYLVSALLLRVTSGYPFPLLPVAAWIAALNLVMAAANWSTRNRVIQMLGAMPANAAWLVLAIHRLTAVEIPGSYDWPPNLWPTLFDFPLTDYALIGAIGLASFGLTVVGVARQRRGDGRAAIPWTPGDGFPDRLVSLFRFPCPTLSATRAQVWFDLKSTALPLLTIGLALAIVNPLFLAVSGPLDAALFGGSVWLGPFAGMFAMLSVLAALVLAANAFGIRARQGHLYASAFEATQPYGTARLAGLKVLVRSVCVLAALLAVGMSVWTSLSVFPLRKRGEPLIEIADVPLSSWQRAIEGAVGALTGYEQLALAVVASMGVAVMVASLATLAALWARYPRRLSIAGLLFLLYGLALVLLALGQRWNGSEIVPLGAILRATSWVAAAAIAFATAYLAWRSFAERVLTLRSACGAVLVSAAFGAAGLTLLRASGVSPAGMPAADAVWLLSPALLPLTTSVLAPWSLSRIRHT